MVFLFAFQSRKTRRRTTGDASSSTSTVASRSCTRLKTALPPAHPTQRTVPTITLHLVTDTTALHHTAPDLTTKWDRPRPTSTNTRLPTQACLPITTRRRTDLLITDRPCATTDRPRPSTGAHPPSCTDRPARPWVPVARLPLADRRRGMVVTHPVITDLLPVRHRTNRDRTGEAVVSTFDCWKTHWSELAVV